MQKPPLKSYRDLRAADFDLAPVWVCAYAFDSDKPWHDEVDEVTYRPWEGALPFDDEAWHVYVVSRAELELADGEQHFGFSRLPDAAARAQPADITSTQPILLLPDGTAIGLYNAR